MTDQTKKRCELFLRNRDAVKTVFRWENGLLRVCCASLYTMRGKEVDTASLERCRKLIRERVGLFSNFRGSGECLLAVMLDESGDPEAMLDHALEVYAKLKEEFMTSSYLPFAAMMIAGAVAPAYDDEVAHRTRTLYERMKKEHPFLTSQEDSTMCAMLALSEKRDDELIESMEKSYALMKGQFFSRNELQALTHVLALLPGTPEAQYDRVTALYQALKNGGRKWGTSYELPMLGVVSSDSRGVDELAQDILECDGYLKQQKGLGTWSSLSASQRLMFASLLAMQEADGGSSASAVLNSAVVTNSSMTIIIAQQAAISASVTACMVASASSASR